MFCGKKTYYSVWIVLNVLVFLSYFVIFKAYIGNQKLNALTNDNLSESAVYIDISGVSERDIKEICASLPAGAALYANLSDQVWGGFGVEQSNWPISRGRAFKRQEALSGEPLALAGVNAVSDMNVSCLGRDYQVTGVIDTSFEGDANNSRIIVNLLSLPDTLLSGRYAIDANALRISEAVESVRETLTAKNVRFDFIDNPGKAVGRLFSNSFIQPVIYLAFVSGALAGALGLILQKNAVSRCMEVYLLSGIGHKALKLNCLLFYAAPAAVLALIPLACALTGLVYTAGIIVFYIAVAVLYIIFICVFTRYLLKRAFI